MLNTFDALAQFGGNTETAENDNNENQQTDDNAAVDISSIVNRLNEMETKINQILNRDTEFPTRGKNNSGDNNDNDNDNENGVNNNASETDS